MEHRKRYWAVPLPCAPFSPRMQKIYVGGASEGGGADALPRSRVPPGIYTVGGTKCPRPVP